MDPKVLADEVMDPDVSRSAVLATQVMDRETTITAPTIGKVPAEALPTLVAAKLPDAPLCGSVLVMIQFDVCEEIRLDELRQILGARTVDTSFKHMAPGYVRFQRPPVEEALEPLVLESGEHLQGEIKYFDYGVVSVVFELPFSGDWDKLVQLSSRWVWDTNFESLATRIVKEKLERAAPALVKPYTTEWLKEDYFIFHLREIAGSPSATDLLASHGDCISQVVRGENQPLSDGERQEILQSRISYYPHDLAEGMEAGLNYVDTAPNYGNSEDLLGNALRGKRDKVFRSEERRVGKEGRSFRRGHH